MLSVTLSEVTVQRVSTLAAINVLRHQLSSTTQDQTDWLFSIISVELVHEACQCVAVLVQD